MWSNAECKGDFTEVGSAEPRSGGEAIHRGGKQASDHSAHQRKENSLQHEGEKNAEARKTKGAKGANLAGARRDNRVHGIHGAKYGPDAHNNGDEHCQSQQSVRCKSGLIVVILALLMHFKLELRIGLDISVEPGKTLGVSQAHGERTLSTSAVEGWTHDIQITPDLTFKGTPGCSKHTHHHEIVLHDADFRSDVQPSNPLLDALADNNFVETGCEVPSLDDFDVTADLKSFLRHGTNRDIGRHSRSAFGQVDKHHDFRGCKRPAIFSPRHTVVYRNQLGLLP